MRRHARHLVEGRIGMDDQAMMDVDHLLGEDHRAAAEGEVVEGRRDGSFEGVLLAHDPERCAPSVDAVEHLVEGGAFEHGRLAETESVRERARCFVGVGSHRPEKRDGVLNVGHLKILFRAIDDAQRVEKTPFRFRRGIV